MRFQSFRLILWAVGLPALTDALPASAQLTNFSRIHAFGDAGHSGHSPRHSILEGSDGLLYGATDRGGNENEDGVIFRVARDGSNYQVLGRFGVGDMTGSQPSGRLIEGSDGALYGATRFGAGSGTVFRLLKDGSGYTRLRSFTGAPDAAWPESGVIEGSDGALYGTTTHGGSNDFGTVYRLTRDGSDYRILRHFPAPSFVGGGPPGIRPLSGLVEGTNGVLFGTASIVSNSGSALGCIYALGRDGGGFAVLHEFGPTPGDGRIPAGLAMGRDGRLYGSTYQGGAHDAGTLFRMDADGSHYELLHSFGGADDGTHPETTLVEDDGGNLFGTTVRGGRFDAGSVFRIDRSGANYTQLHHFSGADGEFPAAALTLSRDGRLYGAAASGGTHDLGVLFGESRDGGDHRTLWNFRQIHGGDGVYPWALMEGRDGFLYATTQEGGSHNSGALVRCSRDGASYDVLHSFWSGVGPDYDWHAGELIEGGDGWIYGTTTIGVGSEEVRLYRIGRDGRDYSVLHVFGQTELTSGETISGVIEASDGALYGTSGGDHHGPSTLYRFDTLAGQLEVRREFGTNSDVNLRLRSGVLEASDGRLYGVALSPGSSGVLYGINKDGTDYRELRRFDAGSNPEGWYDARLLEGSDGWLYGAAPGGDTAPDVIFRIGRDGTGFVVLHQLSPGSGAVRLVEGRDNALYGSAWGSWNSRSNTLFRLNKDGSGFRVLVADGLRGSMIRGRDGAFYGFGSAGGEVDFGTILRFGHALQIDRTPANLFTITGTGIPGYTYALQRSSDLAHWTTLQTFVMPDSLRVTYEDNAPPGGAAFYRLQVP